MHASGAANTEVPERLLDVLCHELRTPVSSLGALSRAMLRTEHPLEGPARQEALALMLAHAEQLTGVLETVRILAGLLDGGTPSAGSRADVHLPELIDAAAHCAALPADCLHLDVPATAALVHLDAPKVRQVLTNVLENARRHAPGSAVTVRARRRASWLVLTVADGGPCLAGDGSSEANHSESGAAGSGLGSWVVDVLMELVGGRRRVTTNAAGGWTVILELPAAR